jgi:hypothetical protein
MKYILTLLLLLPSFCFAQEGPINIYLKTGNITSTNYAFLENNSGFSIPYVRINNKKGEKISIDQVDHIEGTDQNGVYKYFKPIKLQGREIWGERTFRSDRVEIYYTNIISGTWTASYKSKYYQYSKDTQPLKKLTYRNLKIDFGNNNESMPHLKKANSLRVTQLLLYGLGATLITTGIANNLSDTNDNGNIPVSIVAGAICLYIPWFINTPKQKHFINALKDYK